jgi:hypothetical protein
MNYFDWHEKLSTQKDLVQHLHYFSVERRVYRHLINFTCEFFIFKRKTRFFLLFISQNYRRKKGCKKISNEMQSKCSNLAQIHLKQSKYCAEKYNKQAAGSNGSDGACACRAVRKISDVQ